MLIKKHVKLRIAQQKSALVVRGSGGQPLVEKKRRCHYRY